MFLLAVFLDLGVDPLHQCVSLHQHVGESRTGEDSDHLNEIGSEWQLGELEKKKRDREYPENMSSLISEEFRRQTLFIMTFNYMGKTLSCKNLCWTLMASMKHNINMDVLLHISNQHIH